MQVRKSPHVNTNEIAGPSRHNTTWGEAGIPPMKNSKTGHRQAIDPHLSVAALTFLAWEMANYPYRPSWEMLTESGPPPHEPHFTACASFGRSGVFAYPTSPPPGECESGENICWPRPPQRTHDLGFSEISPTFSIRHVPPPWQKRHETLPPMLLNGPYIH